MRRHITDGEAYDLTDTWDAWTRAKEHQADCVEAVIDICECNADEAVDLLNQYGSSRQMMQAKGIEVHNAEACRQPWKLDGQTGLVMLLAVGGYIVACCLAGN